MFVIPDTYFQLYQSIFEKDLLQETEDFYKNEAQQFHENRNLSQYMDKVRQDQLLAILIYRLDQHLYTRFFYKQLMILSRTWVA